MNFIELIEKRLNLKILEDFGPLLPRSVMVEEYNAAPGVVGNGIAVKEILSYKIQFAYLDKVRLNKDINIVKEILLGLPNGSLPQCEKSNDPNNKRWLATIYFEFEREGDN